MDQNWTLPNTQIDQNSISPNTENSFEGGAYSVLLSWGTAIITAINISLYLFVYHRYGISFLLRVLWSFINVLSLACLFVCCRYGNWCCRPSNHPIEPRRWASDRPSNHPIQTTNFNHDGPVIGIEEDTLDLFPKMLYSDKICQSFKSAEGKELDEAEDNTCCSICLSDYKGSEVVKVIPDCGHMFHIDCIDKWLRQHATCPICRTSLPSGSAISSLSSMRVRLYYNKTQKAVVS